MENRYCQLLFDVFVDIMVFDSFARLQRAGESKVV
jgi:hypothetical protein